jgi:hypothetical protein
LAAASHLATTAVTTDTTITSSDSHDEQHHSPVAGARVRIAQVTDQRRRGRNGDSADPGASTTPLSRLRNQFRDVAPTAASRRHGLTWTMYSRWQEGGRHAPANILPACSARDVSKFKFSLIQWKLGQRRRKPVAAKADDQFRCPADQIYLVPRSPPSSPYMLARLGIHKAVRRSNESSTSDTGVHPRLCLDDVNWSVSHARQEPEQMVIA